MQGTATRRAGLERFNFPEGSGKPCFVLDLASDLPGSWSGGHMKIDPILGRTKEVGTLALVLVSFSTRHTRVMVS